MRPPTLFTQICVISSLGIAGLSASAAPATAHPHVFIDNIVGLGFDGGKVTGIRLQWTFDEFFSATVIAYDKDRDGRFDAAETAQVEQEAFGNLRDYHYFTYVWVDGEPQHPDSAKAFAVRRDKDRVIYSFVVPLREPIDPRHARLEIAVYDEEYYVEVLLLQQFPIRLEGEGSDGCETDVTEDETRPYYFDSVYPQVITLRCDPS